MFNDKNGGLCPIEWKQIPFLPKRIYFIVNPKDLRGGHAHKKEKEVFVCLNGSFKAKIHDGIRQRVFKMDKTGQALYTANMVWHEFYDFSKNVFMLAISSIPYDKGKGYLIDFKKFFELCGKKS